MTTKAKPESIDLTQVSFAADFVEQEVGVYRWMDNWAAMKRNGRDVLGMARMWLARMDVRHITAEELVKTVDKLYAKGGPWVVSRPS